MGQAWEDAWNKIREKTIRGEFEKTKAFMLAKQVANAHMPFLTREPRKWFSIGDKPVKKGG